MMPAVISKEDAELLAIQASMLSVQDALEVHGFGSDEHIRALGEKELLKLERSLRRHGLPVPKRMEATEVGAT